MAEIEIQNLSKKYETKDGTVEALSNVNLTIDKGQIYGIIGMSGAGKSTLIRCINFLEKPTEGKVFIAGKSLESLTKRELQKQRESIAMIFQHFNLLMQKSVIENVCFPLYIQKKSRKEARARALELLEIVGLADKKNAYPAMLSGGQKQRVAIARALACNPKILLCDEATSALDPQTTRSILDLIRQIQAKMNLTVVMITHQMEVVRDACNEVAVLDAGGVVEQGTVQDIFAHPKSAVTRDFLSHISLADRSESQGFRAELSGKNSASSDNALVRWSKEGGAYTLHFADEKTGEPVLSRASRQFPVEFNIRAGGIHRVGEKNIGALVTDIDGTPEAVEEAIAWIKSQGVSIEKEGEEL